MMSITTSPTPTPLTSLLERLHPQPLLDELAPTAARVLPMDRIGLAAARPSAPNFRVFGLWDRRRSAPEPGYEFPVRGTVGAWVREFGCPFTAATRDDLARFPRTRDYLVREDFESSLVVPLDLGRFGRGAMFLLSRRRGAFAEDALAVALRLRDVLEPGLQAWIAADEFAYGSDDDEDEQADGHVTLTTSTETRRNGAATGGHGSKNGGPRRLDEVQRAHIEAVLEQTGGVIEGPRGAAEILGVRPSTLRNRMRKLGVTRRPGVVSDEG